MRGLTCLFFLSFLVAHYDWSIDCMFQKTCQSWLAVDLCQSWLAQDQCYDFFLLSDWLIQNLPLFWFWLWCHLCHLWRQNCAYFGNPDWNFINKSMSLFKKFWLLFWKKSEASLLWSLSRLLDPGTYSWIGSRPECQHIMNFQQFISNEATYGVGLESSASPK